MAIGLSDLEAVRRCPAQRLTGDPKLRGGPREVSHDRHRGFYRSTRGLDDLVTKGARRPRYATKKSINPLQAPFNCSLGALKISLSFDRLLGLVEVNFSIGRKSARRGVCQ